MITVTAIRVTATAMVTQDNERGGKHDQDSKYCITAFEKGAYICEWM